MLLENLQRLDVPMGLVTGNMEDIAWLKLEKVGLMNISSLVVSVIRF
jgi:phosphoglycolate phosphatase-like HAD superfamily hydrolase